MRLAAQNDAVVENLEAVGGQGVAGRGDVDDQFSEARRRGSLRRAAGFHQSIVGNSVAGKECAGLHEILGGDPQASSGAREMSVGDIVDVGHGLHVDPALRRGDHEVGPTEAECAEEQNLSPADIA